MNITEEVKDYNDICRIDGVDPVKSLPYPEPKNQDEEAVNSVAKVFRINRVLNQGWAPNWYDWDEYKYYPWFDMSPEGDNAGSGSGFSYCGYADDSVVSLVGSRLVYKTKQLAEFAGKTFLEEYKGYMIIKP